MSSKKLLRYADLNSEFGIKYSRTHLARLEAAGEFPKRIPLQRRAFGYLESEIIDWIEGRVAKREAAMCGGGR